MRVRLETSVSTGDASEWGGKFREESVRKVGNPVGPVFWSIGCSILKLYFWQEILTLLAWGRHEGAHSAAHLLANV
jgi:hypothetical protein